MDYGVNNQPGGDIFVARITEVGDTITDALGSWVPHGWQELRQNLITLAYEDNELGRNGHGLWQAGSSVPVNPGVVPGTSSGVSVPVGTVVFMRLRGWNKTVRGMVYDIMGAGISASTTTCTPVITAIDWTACTYTIKYITGTFTISDTPC